jgi:aerobic carbon-monoxide dehydrogenase medium subunit
VRPGRNSCIPPPDRAAAIVAALHAEPDFQGKDSEPQEDAVIPGPFAYHRPKSVAEAVAMLADLGAEARPLAGGHSLIPMMKLRLAAPEHLVDLGGLGELKGIKTDGNDIVIGAMTTQQELIADATLAAKLPILRETALQIADPQVRYVGTIGGNVANGDPGNDMPALMLCLGASYQIASKTGQRRIAARDFYEGAYMTALSQGEMVTAVRIPVPPAAHGYAYEKLKRKVGDYATAAAAVILTMAQGKVATCSIGLTNLSETPLWAEAAAKAVIGTALDAATLKKAAAAAEAIANPASDNRGPAAYRKKMAGVMTARALQRAQSRAK